MEERENVIELYEIYKGLLTDKQRKYFESYYYEDLSLNEIASNNGVSKSLVGKVINNINNKLFDFESVLGFKDKEDKILNVIKNSKEDLKNKIEEILYNN